MHNAAPAKHIGSMDTVYSVRIFRRTSLTSLRAGERTLREPLEGDAQPCYYSLKVSVSSSSDPKTSATTPAPSHENEISILLGREEFYKIGLFTSINRDPALIFKPDQSR